MAEQEYNDKDLLEKARAAGKVLGVMNVERAALEEQAMKMKEAQRLMEASPIFSQEITLYILWMKMPQLNRKMNLIKLQTYLNNLIPM